MLSAAGLPSALSSGETMFTTILQTVCLVMTIVRTSLDLRAVLQETPNRQRGGCIGKRTARNAQPALTQYVRDGSAACR